MFLTKAHKILPFSKRQNSQKTTKTALAVCWMLITFLQEVMRVISGFIACSLAQNLLQRHQSQ